MAFGLSNPILPAMDLPPGCDGQVTRLKCRPFRRQAQADVWWLRCSLGRLSVSRFLGQPEQVGE